MPRQAGSCRSCRTLGFAVTVYEMCRLAAADSLGSVQWEVSPEELFECIAIIRGQSEWNRVEAGWYYTPETAPIPVTADMEIAERFMSLEYKGHYPIAVLLFHESEEDLVRSILSPGGHFNPFTTFMTAFKSGEVSPFQCSYVDDSGSERKFCKLQQSMSKDPFGLEYGRRRLEWR